MGAKPAQDPGPDRALRRELLHLARLAGPLIGSECVGFAAPVATNLVAGHLGPAVLGAVAVGTGLWVPGPMLVLGATMSIPPIVSAEDGAGDRRATGAWFRQALLLGLGVGTLAGAILFLLGPTAIRLVHVAPSLRPGARAYLRVIAFGLPAISLYAAARGIAEGLSRTKPVMLADLAVVVPIAAAAWCLMTGGFGVPALGAAGAALAAVLGSWAQAVGFIGWMRRTVTLGIDWHHEPSWRPDRVRLARMAALGAPIAVTLVMEVGMFTAAGLVTAAIGPVAAAASQVALNIVAAMFMVPLGLSLAATIRVGHATGRAEAGGVRRAVNAGAVALGLVVVVEAAVLALGGRSLARLYTTDDRVLRLATGLLGLWVLGVVPDGVQVMGNAVLRGFRDTRLPMALTAFAYWGVGVPLMVVLAFPLGFGARGAWFGMLAGSSTAAVLLGARVRWCLRRNASARVDAAVPAQSRAST